MCVTNMKKTNPLKYSNEIRLVYRHMGLNGFNQGLFSIRMKASNFVPILWFNFEFFVFQAPT